MPDQSLRLQLEGDDQRHRTLALGNRHGCAIESNCSRALAKGPELSGRDEIRSVLIEIDICSPFGSRGRRNTLKFRSVGNEASAKT